MTTSGGHDPVPEALPALDLDNFAELPSDFGTFSFESLCVTYDFTRGEHDAARAGLRGASELPEPLKTVAHETTHLLHATTTPFGLFVYRMRRLQVLLVSDAVRVARSGGHAMTLPLQKSMRALPRAIRSEVEQRLRAWYGVEILLLVMMGEVDVWMPHVVRNPYLQSVSVAQLFAQAQYLLAQLTGEDLEIENVSPSDVAAEAPLMAFDVLAGGANTLAVIETAGTVAEYAGCSRLDLDQFKAEILGARWIHTTVPKQWLESGLHQVRASTLPEFVGSYLALCEVALFTPVLAEHRPLRRSGIEAVDILPFRRWQLLLQAASQVPALESVQDYERYTGQVCGIAGLVPPRDLVQASVTAAGGPPAEPREFTYWKAQRIRSQTPGAFVDPLRTTLQGLPMDLDFPVIRYTDRTLFVKDKERLHRLLLGYLVPAVLRRMLLRPDLNVQMPYPPTAEESTFLAGELKGWLEQTLEVTLPEITIS